MSPIGPALTGILAAQAQLNVTAQATAGAAAPSRPQPAAGYGQATAASLRPQQPGPYLQIEEPEADEASEQADRMQALTQFKANLQSLLAGDEMFKSALKIV